MVNCPECGTKMKYNRDLKVYVCLHCGLTLTSSEIDEIMDRKRKERKTNSREEYLKWWLKKEK
ncbi:MAG: hypothetical protein ACTSR0_05725 [Candidatus Asgardarchaeia archaeon]